MAFSKAFLDEVKERNEITEIINRHVPLKRAGSNFTGLCPFHSEKTPSFTVFPATQNYYCFGCGAGGDVVTFVMNTEGLDYPAAIEFLANRAGIPMERDNTYHDFAPTVKKERVIEAMREAGKFFYAKLLSPEGEKAREYLKKREFSDLTVKRFGIGYSPDSWDSLTTHLLSKGFTPEELKASFLSGSSKSGKLFDIFRNRVMFPVFDLTNNPVAFSARRLNEEDERKYVNTSDTPAFKKSRILFGLNIAKNSNDGSIILCEGAVDAIMLHQAGFSNACATLGTAITNDHARIIARIVNTAYLAYDIDKAGRKATDKAIKYLNEAGIATKIINLGSETKDPDEFIKKYGADAFRRRLKASEGQNEYTINTILAKYTIDIPDEKSFAAREICAFIASLDSGTDRDIYTNFASSKLQISSSSLAEDIERIRRSNAKKEKQKFSEDIMQNAEGFGDKINRDKVRFSSAATIEEKILGILLTHPDLGPDAAASLSASDFVTAFNAKLFDRFSDDFKNGRSVNISSEGLESGEVAAISRMMAERELAADNGKAVLTELISKLKRQKEISDSDAKLKDDPSSIADYINKLRNKK